MRRTLLAVSVCAMCAGVASAAPLPPSGTLDLNDGADATIAGEGATDWAGWAVANAGDVNGDKIPDLLVAAPKADPHGRQDAGTVHVIFGPNTGLPAKLPGHPRLPDRRWRGGRSRRHGDRRRRGRQR